MPIETKNYKTIVEGMADIAAKLAAAQKAAGPQLGPHIAIRSTHLEQVRDADGNVISFDVTTDIG